VSSAASIQDTTPATARVDHNRAKVEACFDESLGGRLDDLVCQPECENPGHDRRGARAEGDGQLRHGAGQQPEHDCRSAPSPGGQHTSQHARRHRAQAENSQHQPDVGQWHAEVAGEPQPEERHAEAAEAVDDPHQNDRPCD
jgi:hypothetical protein